MNIEAVIYIIVATILVIVVVALCTHFMRLYLRKIQDVQRLEEMSHLLDELVATRQSIKQLQNDLGAMKQNFTELKNEMINIKQPINQIQENLNTAVETLRLMQERLNSVNLNLEQQMYQQKAGVESEKIVDEPAKEIIDDVTVDDNVIEKVVEISKDPTLDRQLNDVEEISRSSQTKEERNIDDNFINVRFIFIKCLNYESVELNAAILARTNIFDRKSQHTNFVFVNDAIPILINLFDSHNQKVNEQVIWAIGIFNDDETEKCFKTSFLQLIFTLVSGNPSPVVVCNVAWIMVNKCYGEILYLHIDDVEQLFTILLTISYFAELQNISDTVEHILFVTKYDHIQLFMDNGMNIPSLLYYSERTVYLNMYVLFVML
uniref:Uncharacterized protein n=1 Tax=Panagrolaimus sp. ES5 TaxID=591445 RepID=A0AC34FSW8_9BILA